ncbi:hypothetical protein LCGC14_0440970 [marine sediment metagenome]|uniref:Thermostable hemolysin n=1 Tax=marine sediment metagenome TaxID=412755 RepID=A0A0F9SKD8_9ZZZZ|nr:hemolysin [Methylophaga sp.]
MEAVNVEQSTLNKNSRLVARSSRVLLAHMPIRFDHADSPHKHVVETFVADRFRHHYQANITNFLPYLISTETNEYITAAIGFKPADSLHALFLEQYLTSSIEAEISRLTNQVVDRHKIAEVGNLTSIHRGTSQLLFVLTIAILHQAGFEWSVFTATKQVQHLLARLNLVTITVCEANPDNLIDGKQSWGRYYDDRPNVLIGNLTDAITLLKQHDVIGFILKNYQKTIVNIAKKMTR